jgi:hypothetical protein
MKEPLLKHLYYAFRFRYQLISKYFTLESRENRRVKKLIEEYTQIFLQKPISPDEKTEPVWVLGMFRSGTSLVCDVLLSLGADFGKKENWLQPVGVLKDLNPNGFFEDYIFAEYSRYILHKLNSWGDNPPDLKLVEKLDWNDVEIDKMIDFSFHVTKEDRITFEQKIKTFKTLCKLGLNLYVSKEIAAKNPYIKIPMLTLLTPMLIRNWPKSKFLVVFRNPDSVVKSSQILSKKSDYQLYHKYYAHLIDLYKSRKDFYFISYDNFIEKPEESAAQLVNCLRLSSDKINEASQKIDKKLFRNKPNEGNNSSWPEEVTVLYKEMMNLAINK